MTPPHEEESLVDNILAEYLVAEQEGHAPDQALWLKAHPRCAAELEAFFIDRAQLADIALPLQAVARAAQMGYTHEPPVDEWATTPPPPAKKPGQRRAPDEKSGQSPALLAPRSEPQDALTCDHIEQVDSADPAATQPGRKSPNFNKATGGPSAQVKQAGAVVVPGYEILSVLGKGGMGVVYKAHHLKLNRIVALKMIKAGTQADEEEIARFDAEAESVARLQHPNIVQIHEIGEHDGQPYFALEFCGGGSLDRKLRNSPMSTREAAQLVQTLARAMGHAHINA